MILAILWATALFGYLFIKLRRLDRDFLLRVNTIIEKRALVNAALDGALGEQYPYTKKEDDLMPSKPETPLAKVKATKVTVNKKPMGRPRKGVGSMAGLSQKARKANIALGEMKVPVSKRKTKVLAASEDILGKNMEISAENDLGPIPTWAKEKPKNTRKNPRTNVRRNWKKK